MSIQYGYCRRVIVSEHSAQNFNTVLPIELRESKENSLLSQKTGKLAYRHNTVGASRISFNSRFHVGILGYPLNQLRKCQ